MHAAALCLWTWIQPQPPTAPQAFPQGLGAFPRFLIAFFTDFDAFLPAGLPSRTIFVQLGRGCGVVSEAGRLPS